MLGASTGTSMKTMNTRLITRAIASASNRSRTMATTSTRVTAADAPCSARAAISNVKLSAMPHSRANAAYSAIPVARIGLRPKRSASGPHSNWVEPKPNK